MDMKDVVGLIVAIVVANWSAMGTAIKCRDKIDASRNLLWGISGDTPQLTVEMIRFIVKSDIVGFLVGLVWVLCAVGVVLTIAAYYLQDTNVPGIIVALYSITGVLMFAAGIVTGVLGWLDIKKIKKYALERLNAESYESDKHERNF